jgi:uncharacterized membrane protein YvlD (DUF360 family)
MSTFIKIGATAAGLYAATWLLDGLEFEGGFGGLLLVSVLIFGVNLFVRPIIKLLSFPVILITLGLFTFVLNALFIWVAAEFVDGIEVRSFWTALGVAFWLTVVNLFVGGLLNINDDHVWRQQVVQRMVRRTGDVTRTDVPGFLFVQIDGLGHDVLVDAMASGHAPFLARLVERGTHRLHGWECDLSSQTGAMQAGILLGDNHNMPAFRWYEKDGGRVLVTNRPNDAAELESRHSTGEGLLANGGASRANVFSGDAPDAMFTFSTVPDAKISASPSTGMFENVASPPTHWPAIRCLPCSMLEVLSDPTSWRMTHPRGA